MLSLVNNLKSNLKIKYNKLYIIDNFPFKCHYRYTMYLLFILTLLVTSQELIGEHIKCISDKGVDQKVINTFCFFTTTFTMVKYLNTSMINEHSVPHPGIGSMGINSEEPIKRHAYYQWVPFVLFIQALTFYIPHFIWKRMEGGRMKNAVQGLEFAAYASTKSLRVGNKTIPTAEEIDEKLSTLTNAFQDHKIINQRWAIWLIACEFLNLVNLVLQITLTNTFLAGDFITLGSNLLKTGIDSEVYILDKVFPKITKCTFHKYGPSGTVQSHDAMCVMALNIINEKIFTILWFWYIILLVISIGILLWRLVTAIVITHTRNANMYRVAFGEINGKNVNPYSIMDLMDKSKARYVDWLFLTYMSKNMDPLVFHRFLEFLHKTLDDSKFKEYLPYIDEDSLIKTK